MSQAFSGYPTNMSQLQSPSGQPTPSPAIYPQGGMTPNTQQAAPPRALYGQTNPQESPGPQSAQFSTSPYYQVKGQQPPYPSSQQQMYRQQV